MVKGFISYAHADAADGLCDMFRKQLDMLKHSGIAAFWADHEIETGDPWKDVIPAFILIDRLPSNQAKAASSMTASVKGLDIPALSTHFPNMGWSLRSGG